MAYLPSNKTKIVATIGPASELPDVMERMILAGMNVARLNFSHGDFAYHHEIVERLRKAAAKTGRPLSILADLPGPKMRIGGFEEEPIELNPGDAFTLTTDEIVGNPTRVSVSFAELPEAVEPGNTLFLNDGMIQLEVVEVEGGDVRCRVLVGGELRSRKGLNLPGIRLGISAFTDYDKKCLGFAFENGIDAVSQSFVESAADIDAVRSAARELGYDPFIVAKIERSGALDNVAEIMEAADGIMIARGDLGVEVPIEQIAVIQKHLTRQGNMRAKPVITATQMLESMTSNRRPTRAEATDVANAIMDGTDCVMLSEESAMGRYPVDAVAMLARIATAIEPYRTMWDVKELFKGIDLKGRLKPAHLVVLGVETALRYASPAAVFVPTRSGETARRIAGFRLPVWVVAMSSREETCRRLLFSYGIFPVHEALHPLDWKGYIERWLADHGIKGNQALLTEGPSAEHPEANHSMEIVELGGLP